MPLVGICAGGVGQPIVVLDPFAGSGTTALACERTGRRACVVEIEPRYADVSVIRWQQYSGQQARLEQEGWSFEEAAERRRASVGIEDLAA
jgi:hypothetical protein